MTLMSVRWFPTKATELDEAPSWLRPWLLEQGSLTQRLKGCCPGKFSLQMLDERDVLVGAYDAATMAIPLNSPARERKVNLCCDETPCIYAHSILPASTLVGAGATLATLGARPLGDALFTFEGLHRGPIEVTFTECGWGRRSVFRIDGEPLLVTEWFLEGLARCAV